MIKLSAIVIGHLSQSNHRDTLSSNMLLYNYYIFFINRERPLAFYVFTENSSTFEKIAGSTSSGCVAQNNTILYAGGKNTCTCTYIIHVHVRT